MSTPLNTIFSWFETGDFPTQAQFQATFSSFFHRDDTIPISKVEGLANMFQGLASSQTLNLHLNDADAHANVLAKRDAENITAEHALRWKDKLGITYMATIDSDPEANDGNVYDKEQITAFFATVNQAYTEWGNMIQEIRQALMSNDLNLDELQEIVDYIKQNREEIELIKGLPAAPVNDTDVKLTYTFNELGGLSTQLRYNMKIASLLGEKIDTSSVGEPGGVVPLDAQRKIPEKYLPGMGSNVLDLLTSLHVVDEETVTVGMMSGTTVTVGLSEPIRYNADKSAFYNGVFIPESLYTLDNNQCTINLGLLGMEPKSGDLIVIKYYKQ